MREIECIRCGAKLDAEQGVCPVCGAVYYVLPPEETEDAPETASTPSPEPEAAVPSGTEEDDFVLLFSKEEPEDTQEPTPPPPRRPRPAAAPPAGRPSRRVTGYVVGAAVMLAVLTVLLCVMSGAFDFGGQQGGTEKVPALLGLSERLAVAQIEDAGFTPSVSYAQSDETAGAVIEQEPDADTKLERGAFVRITVSNGPAAPAETPGPVETEAPAETVPVPPLTGRSRAEAESLLGQLGLHLEDGGSEYSSYTEGQILRQEPEADTPAAPGSAVRVIFSRGPEPPELHTISVTVGKGGEVSPRGRVSVPDGGAQSFTITPDPGYEVREIRVDGEDIGAAESYTFREVTGDHSLYVVFGLRAGPEETEPPAETPPPASEPPAETETPGLPEPEPPVTTPRPAMPLTA